MSFIKIALWGGVILLLLPSNGGQRFALYDSAKKTVADVASFCERNPDVCTNAIAVVDGIGDKLNSTAGAIENVLHELGIAADRTELQEARLVADRPEQPRHYKAKISYDRLPSHEPVVDLDPLEDAETTSSYYVQDTLTADDLQPEWGGPNEQ